MPSVCGRPEVQIPVRLSLARSTASTSRSGVALALYRGEGRR